MRTMVAWIVVLAFASVLKAQDGGGSGAPPPPPPPFPFLEGPPKPPEMPKGFEGATPPAAPSTPLPQGGVPQPPLPPGLPGTSQQQQQYTLADIQARFPGMPVPYTFLLHRGLPFKGAPKSEWTQYQAEIDTAAKAGNYKDAADWKGLQDGVAKPDWRQNSNDVLRSGASKVGNAAVGLGAFTAAYLVKEGMHSLEQGDSIRFRNAVDFVKSPAYWVTTGISAGTMAYTRSMIDKSATITNLANGTSRMGSFARGSRIALPIFAAVTTLNMLQAQAAGEQNMGVILKDSAITTGAYTAAHYLVTGIGMNLLTRGAVAAGTRFGLGLLTRMGTAGLYAPLLAAGPFGWAGAGVLFVAQTALTMYVGDKIEDWLRGFFAHKTAVRKQQPQAPDANVAPSLGGAPEQPGGGLADKVNEVGERVDH